MSTARVAKQLLCKMPTRVGLLADVAEAIRAAGVNITGICAYEMEGGAEFMLVTDDNAKATEALARLGSDITEQDVVAVDMPDQPGALEEVARKIAEAGVNIEYMYGTTGGGASATCIMRTADADKVVGLVNR